MSDDYLRLIPSEPTRVPGAAAQQRVLARLRELLARAEEVRARVTEHVEFVDPGENFEGVHCPACGADLGDWWSAAMDRAHLSRFADLAVTTPCCRSATSLNELRHEWPGGFARFVLEATNPDVTDLPAAALAELEQLVGSSLRVIRARY